MYCPNCAIPLSEEQKFCRSCGIDVQIISQFLPGESQAVWSPEPEALTDEGPKSRKATMQRRGIITILSSLLIGCLIPIAIGLLSGYSWLNQLILVLSGLAGLVLFTGCIVLIFADGLSKSEGDGEFSSPGGLRSSQQTKKLPPGGHPDPVPHITEQTTDLLEAARVKGSRESN
jgi:hypothetical protein